MRIAIVGAGAMGSVYAGLLGGAGHEVWAVDPWLEHVEAIRERGLRVEGASGDRLVRVHATSDPTDVGTVDLVVIATKAMDVRGAAESAGALLGRETVVLPIQNGLGPQMRWRTCSAPTAWYSGSPRGSAPRSSPPVTSTTTGAGSSASESGRAP